MKMLIIFSLICCSTKVKGGLYAFPADETPSVSMLEALNFFKELFKKRPNSSFDPRTCYLMGGPNKGEGAWVITQFNKNGDEIHCVYHFPKDMCIINTSGNGRIVDEAFKRNGTPIPLEKVEGVEKAVK